MHSVDYPGLDSEKVVLITAAADGIGSLMAEAFSVTGCKVHICDVDEQALAVFLENNPMISGTLTDVSDAAQVALLFEELRKRYGQLDILINNAGIAGPAVSVDKISVEDWRKTLGVDLDGVFYCTRLAAPLVAETRGSILNMSSTAGLFGCPNRSAYVAAKWAIRGLTKTWAMELGPQGVRVNALCPGSVAGSRMDGVMERDAAQRGVSVAAIERMYTSQTSMRRFVEAEDVVNMALFISSQLGRHISGQCLAIDGHTESLSDVDAGTEGEDI